MSAQFQCACGATISRKATRCVECAKPFRAAAISARRRAVPADFAEVAVGKGLDKLVHHYSAGLGTVKRWLQESGIDRGQLATNGWVKRPAPDDFTTNAPVCTVAQLCHLYGVSSTIISRWLAETGATPIRTGFVPNRSRGRPFQPHRDVSPEGQAAAFLQRFGPVFRCDRDGNPNPKGTHWRRGSFVLSGTEIIDRAVRNGWDANAWRKIA